MLIDSHTLLWHRNGDVRLSTKAAKTIGEGACLLSVASVWEISIKAGLGKLELRCAGKTASAEQFLKTAIETLQLRLLPIEFEDATEVESLPTHHADPFDRLLIAQALRRNLPLISGDKVFDRYGIKRVW
jgi:PIN domain nuclease of toxin-antitoxin system